MQANDIVSVRILLVGANNAYLLLHYFFLPISIFYIFFNFATVYYKNEYVCV